MLLERARELDVQEKPSAPILMGRHLLELGLVPGKDFGLILDRAYDAQLEGQFFDLPGVMVWLRQQPDLPLTPEARRKLADRCRGEGQGSAT
jgi:tRNA nucleotidyltransferase (CCA-adding enzyme)